jgi:hypothetical protein
MSEKKTIYPPKGTFNFRDKHENAPDWLLYRMGINAEAMIEWLQGEAKQYLNDQGWLNFDVTEGKYGPSLQVNTYGLQTERKPPSPQKQYEPEPPPPSAAPEVKDFFAEHGSRPPWEE